MVTDRKLLNAPLARYRLGTALIWLGGLTWAPYIFLRVMGQGVSLLWFLPFHLVGVIGGSRLRADARRELGMLSAKRNLWRILGHGLIWAGVAVWAPYFYLKLVVETSVDVMKFLPYHLTGVIGGLLLLLIGTWISRKNEENI